MVVSEDVADNGKSLDDDIVVDNRARRDIVVQALAHNVNDDTPLFGELDEGAEPRLYTGGAAEAIALMRDFCSQDPECHLAARPEVM